MTDTVVNSPDRKDPLEEWRAICDAARRDDSNRNAKGDEHAAENIAEWRQFLPADCVEAMIKHGWHRRV